MSGLSDDVRKKQRLFSEENRQDDTIQSGRREMQTALVHSASDRTRLLRDERQDKEISVVFSLLHWGQKVFFFERGFGSKCEGRQESELTQGYWGRFNEQGWNSLESVGEPSGFKTSQSGRGLTQHKGDRSYHLCHLLVDCVARDLCSVFKALNISLPSTDCLRRTGTGEWHWYLQTL